MSLKATLKSRRSEEVCAENGVFTQGDSHICHNYLHRLSFTSSRRRTGFSLSSVGKRSSLIKVSLPLCSFRANSHQHCSVCTEPKRALVRAIRSGQLRCGANSHACGFVVKSWDSWESHRAKTKSELEDFSATLQHC